MRLQITVTPQMYYELHCRWTGNFAFWVILHAPSASYLVAQHKRFYWLVSRDVQRRTELVGIVSGSECWHREGRDFFLHSHASPVSAPFCYCCQPRLLYPQRSRPLFRKCLPFGWGFSVSRAQTEITCWHVWFSLTDVLTKGGEWHNLAAATWNTSPPKSQQQPLNDINGFAKATFKLFRWFIFFFLILKSFPLKTAASWFLYVRELKISSSISAVADSNRPRGLSVRFQKERLFDPRALYSLSSSCVLGTGLWIEIRRSTLWEMS